MEYEKPSENKTETVSDIEGNLLKELNFYRNQGNKGKWLNKLYHHLLNIKPTSVDSERVFSLAGLFGTRIRSRLSDESLDTLSFLKSFFTK